MLTPTHAPAIQILLDCLAITPDPARPTSYTNEDWQAAAALARKHGILPLLAARAAERFAGVTPPDVAADMLHSSRAQAMRSLQQTADVARVLAALSQGGLSVIVLKGIHLRAEIYQDNLLRSMSDMDLLVQEEHLANAAGILVGLGYTAPPPSAADQVTGHWVYTAPPPALPLELHWKIEGGDADYAVDTASLWQRARPVNIANVQALTLAPEDLLLHLGLHLAGKHLFTVAVLRGLLDLAETLAHFEGRLDWLAIEQRARQWRVSRSVYLALTMAQRFLRAPAPASLWPEIAADPATPGMCTFVEQQIIQQLGGEPASYSKNLGRVLRGQSWKERATALAAALFPPPAQLSPGSRTAPPLWRRPVLYLRHWWKTARARLLLVSAQQPGDVARYQELKDFLRREAA